MCCAGCGGSIGRRNALHASFRFPESFISPALNSKTPVGFYNKDLGGFGGGGLRGGTGGGAVQITETGPLILLASHLSPGEGLPIYRVSNLEAMRRRLKSDGWSDGPAFEIPQGPCLIVRDPGGQRLGIYERVRPHVEAAFEGRFDEG